MRSLALPLLASLALACTTPVEAGQFTCNPASPSCPPGLSCYRRTPTDPEPRCWAGTGSLDFDAGPPPADILVRVDKAWPASRIAASDATLLFWRPGMLGGEPEVVPLGADGAGLIEGIAWNGELAALTVALDGYRIETRIGRTPSGLGGEGDTIAIGLELAPVQRYRVDIRVSDAPVSGAWVVSGVAPSARQVAASAGFDASIDLPYAPGQANDILGVLGTSEVPITWTAYFEETRRDSDVYSPVESLTTLVGSREAPVTRTRRVSLPAWAAARSAERVLDAYPTSRESEGSLRLGLGSTQDQTTQIAVVWTYVSPTFFGEPAAVVEVRWGAAGAPSTESAREVESPIPNRSGDSPVEVLPLLRPPTPSATTLALGDLITWRDDNVDEERSVVRYARADGVAVWDVVVEGGVTEVALDLPEAQATLLGTEGLDVRVHACAGWRVGAFCERSATSAVIRVAP